MNRPFWEARLKQYGHTGWSDPVIYAFDQSMRLAAVTSLIMSHVARFEYAIDFGCGVGDFSQVLGRLFRRVTATDISSDILRAARSRLPSHVSLTMPEDLWARAQGGAADLILSITVLQHIVQDSGLNATLRCFHDTLSKAGILIVLESFGAPSSQNYVRSWTEPEMLARFGDTGFRVVERYYFRNPVTSPTPRCGEYRRHVITRALARFSGSAAAMVLLRWFAARYAVASEAFAPTPTGTDLLVFMKA